MHFELQGIRIPVEIQYSKRRTRTMSIAYKENRIFVSAPMHVTEEQILDALHHRREWLQRVRQEQQLVAESQLNWRYSLMFLGEPMRIQYTRETGSKYRVELKNQILLIQGPSSTLDDETLKELVRQCFRRLAGAEIEQRVMRWSQEMDCTYGQIRIKDLKSRWGSCSRIKNLNFNWRLVCAPPKVIDYVVVHELSHLFEMNHSARFWRKVEEFMPDYRTSKDWLKQHGAKLFF